MKIKHLLIGLFAVAATVACKQDEPVETPSLEVSQESLELTATEAEASFDVTSNVAWTATADQDWVSLDPASGDASKKAVAVTVTAEDNTATEARIATVTVKAGELTKTVALTQAAVAAESGDGEGEGDGNGEGEGDGNGDGEGDGNGEGEGDGNGDGEGEGVSKYFEGKQWVVSLDGETLLYDFGLTQEGVLIAAIEYEGVYYAAMYASYEVVETSATEGKILTRDIDAEGESVEEVTYKITSPTTCEIMDDDEPLELTLVEGTTYEIDLAGPPKEDPMLERELAFSAETAEATLGEDFIAPTLSGATEGVVYSSSDETVATVDPETGAVTLVAAGETTITATAQEDDTYLEDTASYTLVVYPAPAEPVLTLAVNEASVAADATSYEVALTANCAWEAVATDGVTVTPATGEGDATVTLTFAANEVTSPVTHSVTFSAGEGLTAVLTLTQAAAEKPVIADGKYYIVANGKVAKPLSNGYGYLQVTNGKDNSSANAFNFTYVAAQKAYTIQDNSGQYYYQSGTYDSYNRQSNLPTDNSGYWTIEEENGAYRITNVLKKKFVQFDLSFGTYGCYATAKGILPTLLTEGTDVPYMIINPMSVNVNADATSAEFDIQTDMPWTAVVAEGDATLSSYSGSENATVTVTFAANESTEASNTYKVKVSTEYGDEVITISQSKVQTGSMVTDELTAALFKATSTTYTAFTGVSVTSSAVYAGKSAKTSTGGIQLRSSKKEDGIVTTTSGGNVRTVVVTWEDGTTAGRTLDVYGSNVAYASAADLYGDNKGTKLGSIVKGTSTTLEVTGDYAYVGFRSNDGAMYLAKIEVTYE